MRSSGRHIACIVLLTILGSCQADDGAVAPAGTDPPAADTLDLSSVRFSAEPAADWTALFKRDSGWFGGDGIFSVPVPLSETDTATLFWFSDSMIGDIVAGRLTPGYAMVHNSVALLGGNQPDAAGLTFYWKGKGTSRPGSVFAPPGTGETADSWYWLGSGFVNHAREDDIYLFAYQVHRTPAEAGFALGGSRLLVIPHGSRPPFDGYRDIWAPLYVAGSTPEKGYAFGAGVYVNTREAGAPSPDGYVYVYGVNNGPGLLEKDLMVGRVRPGEMEDFDAWRFWDGEGWNLGTADVDRAAVITTGVSDELSLTPLADGRYALVFQTDGIGTSVGMRLAAHPWGPFGPVIKLWDCPEAAPGFITYNAKAHPWLSAPGMLVISYNVNATDFFNQLTYHPYLYRPRFIQVTFH